MGVLEQGTWGTTERIQASFLAARRGTHSSTWNKAKSWWDSYLAVWFRVNGYKREAVTSTNLSMWFQAEKSPWRAFHFPFLPWTTLATSRSWFHRVNTPFLEIIVGVTFARERVRNHVRWWVATNNHWEGHRSWLFARLVLEKFENKMTQAVKAAENEVYNTKEIQQHAYLFNRDNQEGRISLMPFIEDEPKSLRGVDGSGDHTGYGSLFLASWLGLFKGAI